MCERITGFSPSSPDAFMLDNSSGGRGIARTQRQFADSDGNEFLGLIEWVAAEPDYGLLAMVGQGVPIGDDGRWRAEEAHTLRIKTTIHEHGYTGVVYELPPE